MKNIRYGIVIVSILSILTFNCKAQSVSTAEIKTGMAWPKGQAFPTFATPVDTLDGITITRGNFTQDETILFTVLQGLVNKTKPSIILLKAEREGKDAWPNKLGLAIKEFRPENKWDLLKKYQKSVNGVILYSIEKSSHYRNLAITAAGLKNALPVTASEYSQLQSQGINLPVLEDLSGLTYTSPEDIYRYLYEKYWQSCTRRLLISHRNPGFIMDIAAASGAAIIWLDPRKPSENEVLRLFLKDMKAGESIILGWWAEERSGIGIGTEYGISTVAADFYDNATVYAGMNHLINLPVTPKKPKLENKVYISVYLSDGDNIQYCQHTLPKLWDDKGRGNIPVNWTVSPGLADLGPGLLNYFYKSATPNDFFASGPSGLGYALIYDAHHTKWNNTGGDNFDQFTKLTQRYLEKTGLRVITIWDQINENQMESYATNCRYLYGLTQQDWERQKGKIPPYVKQNKLAFISNYPCYTETVDVVVRMNKDSIKNFDGSHPVFLTTQGVSWRMGPDSLVALKTKLEKLSPGNIVFCRGDHFFALYNEAKHMDFNLTLSPEMVITSSPTTTQPDFAADGTCASERSWISSPKGNKWIQFDFKKAYRINRYVIRHAGFGGMDKSYNTKNFDVEISNDGKKWLVVNRQINNKSDVTDVDISPVEARYVRINITNPGSDGIARIGDIEIYGSVK